MNPSPVRSHADQVYHEIHSDLPREGPGRDPYTLRAWDLLPALERPRILDVGCGPGVPTRALARISGGQVVGLDNNPPYLETLRTRSADDGLSDRIHPVRGSLFALPFPPATFDVIWAEGSIYLIGFEQGLREWRRFLRPGGFLAVHEAAWLCPDPPEEVLRYWRQAYPAITTIEGNLDIIAACGLRVLGHFPLPEDAWWTDYYGPLETRLGLLRETYQGDETALAVVAAEQREIDLYRRYPDWFGSVFFVLAT
jgi:SAM-dependent methyltransferase